MARSLLEHVCRLKLRHRDHGFLAQRRPFHRLGGLLDPRMRLSLLRCHPLFRVLVQALVYEVAAQCRYSSPHLRRRGPGGSAGAPAAGGGEGGSQRARSRGRRKYQ